MPAPLPHRDGSTSTPRPGLHSASEAAPAAICAALRSGPEVPVSAESLLTTQHGHGSPGTTTKSSTSDSLRDLQINHNSP